MTGRRRSPLLALAVGCLVGFGLVAVLWALPLLLTRDPDLTADERREAKADVRNELFAGLGALGAVAGLPSALWNYRRGKDAQLIERFEGVADQINTGTPASQLASVPALVRMANAHPTLREGCIDVLCAYLRTATADEGKSAQEVRRTMVAVIATHLRPDPTTGARPAWQGSDFDLTGALLDVGDFHDVRFAEGRFCFEGARFEGGVRFDGARFTGAEVRFARASFAHDRCRVTFAGAAFEGGTVDFDGAVFAGGTVHFKDASFGPRCQVTFDRASLGRGATVQFDGATITGPGSGSEGGLSFAGAVFGSESGGEVLFDRCAISGRVAFDGAQVLGHLSFAEATFTGADLSFRDAVLAGRARLSFRPAAGGDATLRFDGLDVQGGCVDLGPEGNRPRVLGVDPARLPTCPPRAPSASAPRRGVRRK